MPLNRVWFIGILLFFFSLGLFTNAYAQKREIDSLKELLASHRKIDALRIKVLNQLAYDYYSTNLDDLKVYGNQALLLANQIKDKNGEAVAYKNIGLGYMADNANPKALDYFDKSLMMFRAVGDRPNSSKVLNNIGYYYGLIKDRKHEQYYFLQAMQEIDGLPEPLIRATVLGNLGNNYEATGDIAKARDCYNKALDVAIKNNVYSEIATSYGNLASVELKEKNYEQAINYCDTVLKISNRSDNFKPRTLASVYSTLGKIYFNEKQYKEARESLNKSEEIAKKIGNIDESLSNYHDFYQIDSIQGDYKSALDYYRRYSTLNDSLIGLNRNRVVALYQVKYDSQKKLDENQRLRVEDEKNQAVISQQRIIQTLLIIGILIFCAGAIYMKYIYDQVKAKNRIINEQNHVLENSNVVKDKLFSVISHDLRSPITQLLGLLNLWDSGEVTMKEMSTLTPAVKSSISNTLELLDNLLIWSREQLQGFHLKREAFNLNHLVNENILALNSLIQQKQLHVYNEVEPETLMNADREMMQIVLRNLISNAIKFTNTFGTITISSQIKGTDIEVCVEDTGIGIKETDQEKIFSFTSHTTLGTANEKGTGIGLKICKDFIELNNGRIWMESAEGEGSRFCIAIPL